MSDKIYINGFEIKNLKKVDAPKGPEGIPQLYSFTFEAKRSVPIRADLETEEFAKQWVAYGPMCYGTWSVKSGETFRFPSYDTLWKGRNPETICIGWHELNAALERQNGK